MLRRGTGYEILKVTATVPYSTTGVAGGAPLNVTAPSGKYLLDPHPDFGPVSVFTGLQGTATTATLPDGRVLPTGWTGLPLRRYVRLWGERATPGTGNLCWRRMVEWQRAGAAQDLRRPRFAISTAVSVATTSPSVTWGGFGMRVAALPEPSRARSSRTRPLRPGLRRRSTTPSHPHLRRSSNRRRSLEPARGEARSSGRQGDPLRADP